MLFFILFINLVLTANRKTNVTISEGCHWHPPKLGHFKLNMDASWTTSKVGFGDLIRDHQDRVRIVFTGTIIQSFSSKHAETITVREGLKLTKRFGYLGFTIESDCKGIIN